MEHSTSRPGQSSPSVSPAPASPNPASPPDHSVPANPGQTGRTSLLAAAGRTGWASARENARPGLVLWLVALAIVAGYWLLPPVTAALEALGRTKQAGGFLYSALATALFGGLIPFLWRLWLQRRPGTRPESAAQARQLPAAWQTGLFLMLFWAYKGVEVDALYRLQDLLFGTGNTPGTIIPKVLVDQFVYNPLWAGWTQVVAYWFLEQRFRPAALADRALWSTMGQRVLNILISTWGVWIPMVSIIYAMPSTLQIPLFNIALCFWSIMLGSLTRGTRA